MSLFCKHQWKVVEKIEHPAPMEDLKRLGFEHFKEVPYRWGTRKTIVILACEHCGELHETRLED